MWWLHRCLLQQCCLDQSLYHPLIQGITQRPMAIRAPFTTIKEVRVDTITPFHSPNQDSNHPVIQVSIPDFSDISLARVESPCNALAILSPGAVLLGWWCNNKYPALHRHLFLQLVSCLRRSYFPRPSYLRHLSVLQSALLHSLHNL